MRNNKRFLVLFVCAVLCSGVFAQTHRLYYTVYARIYKNERGHAREMVVTDINKNTVKSYSEEFLKTDSINKKDKFNNIFFAAPAFEPRFSRNLSTGITTNYESNLGDVFSYETKDKMNWKIHPDQKVIEGYKAQKATQTFEGRNWEAWFTTELDIPYGPYKFYGLPGLILKIEDDKGDFIFHFAQNKKLDTEYDTSNFLEKYYTKYPLKLSLKDVHRLKMNYFLDPFKEFKNGKKENHHLGSEIGETINYNEKTAEVQEDLRQENPIDLEHSVKYPEK